LFLLGVLVFGERETMSERAREREGTAASGERRRRARRRSAAATRRSEARETHLVDDARLDDRLHEAAHGDVLGLVLLDLDCGCVDCVDVAAAAGERERD
jgi:hypothetical protein